LPTPTPTLEQHFTPRSFTMVTILTTNELIPHSQLSNCFFQNTQKHGGSQGSDFTLHLLFMFSNGFFSSWSSLRKGFKVAHKSSRQMKGTQVHQAFNSIWFSLEGSRARSK
jgi:hypothetical protein